MDEELVPSPLLSKLRQDVLRPMFEGRFDIPPMLLAQLRLLSIDALRAIRFLRFFA